MGGPGFATPSSLAALPSLTAPSHDSSVTMWQMAEEPARSGSAARVLKAVARVPRAPWWVIRHLPPIVWNFLVSRGARIAALLWLAGLGYFLVVASTRTYATIHADGANEAAAAAEDERQRQALSKELVFKDVDELHGEKDKRLARYKGEFDNMIVDAGPPSDGGKKRGGIAGWIRRNKKHTKRAISDKETLKLLNEEMGPGFGALAAVDPEGEGGGISNTLARMKQISKLRGGKGSAQPSEEEAGGEVPAGPLVAAAAKSDESDEADEAAAAATPAVKPKPDRGFDFVSLGNAAATAIGPALEAAAATNVATAPPTAPPAAKSTGGAQEQLREKLAGLAPPGKLDLVVRADRMVLLLPADAFREGRTATLTREARKLLDSAARALEVSRRLVESGVNPNRLSLMGFRQQTPEAVADRVEIQFVRAAPTSRPADGGP